MFAPLNEDDIATCRQAFARFDPDGSGAISAHELEAALVCACSLPGHSAQMLPGGP